MTTPTPRTYATCKAIAAMLEPLRGGTRVTDAEMKAVQGVIDGLAKCATDLERDLSAAQERAEKAEARAEAAEKDAGRYRWLRVQPHADIAACWYMPVLPQDYPVDTPEQRDAAIDAAIAGEK